MKNWLCIMEIKKQKLIPSNPLKILKYRNINGVYSRNNLPKKIKDGAYVINLDEGADVGTH